MNELRAYPFNKLISFLKKNAVGFDEFRPMLLLFYPEISHYCELVQGFQEKSCGLVFRGENQDFTKRQLQIFDSWGVHHEDKVFLGELAKLFEHKNNFLKLEWNYSSDQASPVLSYSCYFRRRPQVNHMLSHYYKWGISENVLRHIAYLASVLKKDSIHFVATSFRQNQKPFHKLYFSQLLNSKTYAEILRKILTITHFFQVKPETVNRLINNYPRLASIQKESTLFISFSFDNLSLFPSMKIDLHDLHYKDCLAILNEDEEKQEQRKLYEFCTDLNTERVSYIGMRFFQTRDVILKYYMDLDRKPD